MLKLGDLNETKTALDLLKNERKVFDMLHEFYIMSLRGGIYEYITICSVDLVTLSGAWTEMQFYIDDVFDVELISTTERDDLIRFLNNTYLEYCEKIIIKKGGKPNGKSERRCDVNSRCNTSRNGRRRTSESETDDNTDD